MNMSLSFWEVDFLLAFLIAHLIRKGPSTIKTLFCLLNIAEFLGKLDGVERHCYVLYSLDIYRSTSLSLEGGTIVMACSIDISVIHVSM